MRAHDGPRDDDMGLRDEEPVCADCDSDVPVSGEPVHVPDLRECYVRDAASLRPRASPSCCSDYSMCESCAWAGCLWRA